MHARHFTIHLISHKDLTRKRLKSSPYKIFYGSPFAIDRGFFPPKTTTAVHFKKKNYQERKASKMMVGCHKKLKL